MQTFMPYPRFSTSIQVLDNKRLGKQRVEASQILDVLTGKSKGWASHPAVRMWKGYEWALSQYYANCIWEWVLRGFKNDMPEDYDIPVSMVDGLYPHWLGNMSFHKSHQSNLVRKDPSFYGPKFPGVDPFIEYVWPEGRE